MTRGRRRLVTVAGLLSISIGVAAQAPSGSVYRPALQPPEFMWLFAPTVAPGADVFSNEPLAIDIETRLRAFASDWRQRRATAAVEALLAPDARGTTLTRPGGGPEGALTVQRVTGPARSADRGALAADFGRLLGQLGPLTAFDFDVIAISAPDTDGIVAADVRFDLVGQPKTGSKVQANGVWRQRWREDKDGWRIVEWTTVEMTTSRTPRAIFTEITAAAFGGTEAFRRQLNTPLDDWSNTLDAALTRDSNGHHGIAAGDADGDGLDDLYVSQPPGLPNRLFRSRGDGTFEDITDRAGVGVLDDTAQSIFADIDNDGDQDLVVATSTEPLLFTNDGTGRFSPVARAFTFDQPVQGLLTGMSMADYDRDGFLDVYFCVYTYFFGASEDKGGTPMPYYDARNGPPAILFRNNGQGRFVEATAATGLDIGNSRYHFAAAWADYDEDGWPDLLVANDFGVKNLYRNLGGQGGPVRFQDVAVDAGVLDHGAGMSAAFLDYDNDGHLDIYTGNMWTPHGLRVTASPVFMPGARDDVHDHYRQHARGNGLYRNLGNGRFEDVSVSARANIGRWAWSSDSLDFDSDGFDDLYVANGMLTRSATDIEGFFWRQIVAQSPLKPIKNNSYDDAWRAMNQWLIHDSIAGRQRNVFLRNDGAGAFDDVSGTVGLDLEQDGRAFSVLDADGDGDPDLAIMAARQAPQLRLFRNDYAGRGRTFTIRLTGAGRSNRDAVGARVVVETDRVKKTRIVTAGSGFLSQHSRTLIFGLGASERITRVTVTWPSGAVQTFADARLDTRARLTEGGRLEAAPIAAASVAPATPPAVPAAAPPPASSWLYDPFPAPPFSVADVAGQTRSLAALAGKPSLLLFWSTTTASGRAAVDALARGRAALDRAGVTALAIAMPAAPDAPPPTPSAVAGVPVIAAPPELAMSYALVYRHVFMNRQDLPLPTAFLVDGAGRIVKVYRGTIDAAAVAADAGTIEAPSAEARLARAAPFPGRFHLPLSPRNVLSYGRELMDQGLEAAALVAFERAAQATPNASTLYRLGTLLAKAGQPARANAAYQAALALKPDMAEALNDLGALQAQAGDLEGAVARFRAALVAAPDYPDALNNLGYALLVMGRPAEAKPLYEQAIALQPDFPEALNNLGLLLGRSGDLDGAERYFRQALDRRASYGEAAGNLALVMVNRGQADAATRFLETFIAKTPAFEGTYVTLARIHLAAGRTREGLAVLERLLQRNPTHPLALEMVRQFRQ
jgi:Tfp pilus assembly protein PilF/peroxiredoxin